MNIILVIILSCVFLLILLLAFAGLTTVISLVRNSKAFKYAMFNQIQCPNNQISCEPIINPNGLPEPQVIPRNYDPDSSRFCLDLIIHVAYNEGLDSIQSLKKVAELNNTMDTSATFGVIWVSENTIWIAFRGTGNNLQEWINNFKITQLSYDNNKNNLELPAFMAKNKNIKIHEGFFIMYDEMVNPILQTIKTYYKEGMQIVVTGHSLGAAVSTILGAELKDVGYDNVIVYTFASPRVGNEGLTDYINQIELPVFRIVNTEDIVPQIPLPVSPNLQQYDDPSFYSHCGVEHNFTENWLSVINNHSLAVYQDQI
jgi:triacylglycerol lipase